MPAASSIPASPRIGTQGLLEPIAGAREMFYVISQIEVIRPTLEPHGGEGGVCVNCPFLFPESQRPALGEGWVPKGKSGPREPERGDVNAGQSEATGQQAVSSSPQRVVTRMR